MHKLLLTALCCVLLLGGAPAATAHELLPKALVEYMAEHPDATPEEIEAFVASDPELRMADGAKLLELARTEPNGFWANAWEFLKLGVEHILSGPDHILFVLSLLLTFVSLRRTIWFLTCFTLSHSVTIILAGSHLLRVSSHLVEPLIALSIAYVAITSVFLAKRYPFFADNKARALTVLGFGFFHGMGFAGALDEVAVPADRFLSSLLSFNLGVDIGQISIVLLGLPALYLARRSGYYERGIQVFAVVISLLALVWFVQRVAYPA